MWLWTLMDTFSFCLSTYNRWKLSILVYIYIYKWKQVCGHSWTQWNLKQTYSQANSLFLCLWFCMSDLYTPNRGNDCHFQTLPIKFFFTTIFESLSVPYVSIQITASLMCILKLFLGQLINETSTYKQRCNLENFIHYMLKIFDYFL